MSDNQGLLHTPENWEVSGEVPEGRCGYTLGPLELGPSAVHHARGNLDTWYRFIRGYCCWRKTWQEHSRCIWHADVAEKSVTKLSEIRCEEPERLDGAVLREIDISDKMTFTHCTLKGAVLNGTVLRGTNLIDTDLKYANLQDANLSNASLEVADLSNASLEGADLSNASLEGADLSESGLGRVNLSEALLPKTDLTDAMLGDADLSGSNLIDADLSSVTARFATLCDVRLGGANLTDADFYGANLTRADLSGAILTNAQFENANLRRAQMETALLKNTVLERANLSYSNLFGADLTGATLYGAILSNVQLNIGTKFGDHYPDNSNIPKIHWPDDDVQMAAWTLSQIEDLARKNALHGQVRNAFTARKDNWRHHYWYHSKIPSWLRWPVTRLKAAGNELTTRLVARLRVWVNDDTRTEADTVDEDTGSDDAPTSEAETLDNPAADPSAEDFTAEDTGSEDLTNWQRWVNTGRWAWLALTGATTRYGESPRRVVGTSLAVILGFGVVYPFVGGMKTTTADTEAYRLADWLSLPVGDGTARIVFENLYFSAVTFTTLGYGDIQPGSDTTKLLASMESLLGALLMALLVAVLARRITR